MPGKEMLRYARILTDDGSMTCCRKPRKLPGPALPASTRVVVPRAAPGRGVDAHGGAAPVYVGMKVDQTGGHDRTRDVPHVVRGSIDACGDLHDLSAREADVHDAVDAVRGSMTLPPRRMRSSTRNSFGVADAGQARRLRRRWGRLAIGPMA